MLCAMEPWLDTRYDPLFVQIFPPGYTADDLSAGFDRLEAFYLERIVQQPSLRAVHLADMTHVERTSARNRKRIAEAFDRLAEPMSGRILGQAFVLPRTFMRHAMTAVFWIRRPPWPVKAFARHEEALVWLRGRRQEEGLDLAMPDPWWDADAPVDELSDR